MAIAIACSQALGQLRQIIKENDLKSAGDVYALLKDSFKELLQELLEAELDVSMGYDKNNKGDIDTDNKRFCINIGVQYFNKLGKI